MEEGILMQLTHFGHSCLLVELDGTRLLFDPGTFSDGFTGLNELDAVLITHQNPTTWTSTPCRSCWQTIPTTR
jgi:Cft2 family RNA processing exonuclease